MDLCVSYQIILSNSWMLGSDFRFESMCKLLDHMIQLLATRKLNLEKDLLGLSQSLGDVSLNRDKCSWSTPSYSQIQEIFCYSVLILYIYLVFTIILNTLLYQSVSLNIQLVQCVSQAQSNLSEHILNTQCLVDVIIIVALLIQGVAYKYLSSCFFGHHKRVLQH